MRWCSNISGKVCKEYSIFDIYICNDLHYSEHDTLNIVHLLYIYQNQNDLNVHCSIKSIVKGDKYFETL